MSSLRVDNISARTGTTITIPSGNSLYAPGHIIQVVNTYLTAPFSQSITSGYTTYNDIPGLAATITPKNINSKIYMTVRWFGEYSPQSSAWSTIWGIKRNGSPIRTADQPGTLAVGIMNTFIGYYGNDADSTPESTFFDCYDTPASLSAVTYQVYLTGSASPTLYTNRCVNSTTSNADYERGTSSITLFEIAG